MTLTTLLIRITIVAIIFTLLNVFVIKNTKSWLMSLFQNFTGVLFLFSGWVKAADPLGTAYKMEQYFDEFSYTFEPTWFGFMKPMFEYFSTISISFSVGMIIFEMVLGLMLLLGAWPKLTSWLFFGLVFFFTILTGFTYLTGYVQEGGNFFDFSTWGAYKKSNMKVTDCGCFGDFIKLEPKTSFFKDVFLLLPATYFVWKYGAMHQFFSKGVRTVILTVFGAGLLVYCMSNYVWNLPHADFRPFKVDADVAAIKQMEDDAAADVQIVAWELKNETTNEQVTLPTKEYFANLSKYSKDNGWKVTEQISTEPSIKPTKISAFEVTDFDGNDVSYEYLDSDNYQFMIVSHKAKYSTEKKSRVVQDSIYVNDTIMTPGTNDYVVAKTFDKIVERAEDYYSYNWDADFLQNYTLSIKPLADQVNNAGHKISIVTGGADQEVMLDFASQTGITADYYTADDILLKTIVRSNPGVVLWKNGKILDKWHINKLPTYSEIAKQHLQ